MSLASSTFPDTWRCLRLRSPLGALFGSVVEADGDVLGVAWDVDPTSADARALGEAVERSALHQDPHETVNASACALGRQAIGLEDRVTFSADQRSASPALAAFDWDCSTESTWTPMRSSNGDRLVPVDLARIRLTGMDPSRPKPMTSIGTACGSNWSTALGRALMEAVERHSVASAVYRQTRAKRVDPALNGAPDVVASLGVNAELWTGMLPSDPFGASVAVAAVLGTAEGLPQAAFGTAAAASAESALRSAALEAVHVFHLGWRLLRRGASLGAPTTINQRALWWATHGRAHVQDYFTEGGQMHHLPRPRRDEPDGAWLAAKLKHHQHEWAYADITPPWSSGVVVARVVVPSLLHLQINEFPFLVAPRFSSTVNAYVRGGLHGAYAPHPFV